MSEPSEPKQSASSSEVAENTLFVEQSAISPEAIDHAMERIREAVKGNGYDHEKIHVDHIEGVELLFTGKNKLSLKTSSSEKILPGKHSVGSVVENKQALENAISETSFNIKQESLQKIRALITQRADKGFGLDDEYIDIPFLTKDYTYVEPCQKCSGSGSLQCMNCSGSGSTVCGECHGSTIVTCPTCHGSNVIMGANGQSQQCPRCSGQGSIGCVTCSQKGHIDCHKCKRSGHITCDNCKGHGHISYIHRIEVKAHTRFTYDTQDVPEDICKQIDQLGSKIEQYAKIEIDNIDESKKAENKDFLSIIYNVKLPYGHLEFKTGKSKNYALLFGYHYKLTYVSSFIDPLIKEGLRSLKNAGESRGSTKLNLEKAAQYRCIHEGIIACLSHSKKKSAQKILASTPLGLSKQSIKQIVIYADRAIKAITLKPRQKGFLLSLLLMSVFFALYFLLPLRNLMVLVLPQESLQILFDLSLIGVFSYINFAVIRSVSALSMSHILKNLLTERKKHSIKIKTGVFGGLGILACSLLFLFFLELARQIGNFAPSWYTQIWL